MKNGKNLMDLILETIGITVTVLGIAIFTMIIIYLIIK